MTDRPKVLLIYPPQAQPFLPHLALPLLAGVLKSEGIDAVVRDLNLEAYEHFLSPPVLQELGMDASRAARVEAAKADIRNGREHFDPDPYFDAIRTLQDGLSFVCTRHEGLTWTLKTFDLAKYSYNSWQNIRDAANDRDGNIFVKYFESRMPDLAREAPDLIGISIAWSEQLIPAFTLARVLKAHMPEVPIVVGGSMVSHLVAQFRQKPEVFSYVDYLLPMEGEAGIVKLARGARSGSVDDVPNLVFRRGEKVVTNRPAPNHDLKSLPVPDFDGLPLQGYYSPRVYLPLLMSRGCYWGKCAFCSHHMSGSSFRQRRADDVVAEMDALYERYGCLDFYISDDSLPPNLGLNVARLIADGGRPYRWAAEIRMEEKMDDEYFRTLYAGGARLLLFGLETGSQKMLDLMDKGLDLERAGRVLRRASDAGIKTWVFFFLGFPGETKDDAQETLQFLIDMREHIDMVAGGTFALTRNAPMFQHTARYGIEFVVDDPRRDLDLAPRFFLEKSLEYDARGALRGFKRRPEVHKFMAPFVAETHLMFFEKSHFREKATV